MAALREILAQFGIEVDTAALGKADDKIKGFINGAKKVAAATAAAFAVKEIWDFAKSTAHAMDALEDTAETLGITTDAVQEMSYAARAMGDDAEFMFSMMGRLQVAATKMGKSGDETGDMLAKLGVKTKDANGQLIPADILMEDVAAGLEKVSDANKRAAIATQIFGRGGRQLLPFLLKGREGIKALRKEFTKLGGGFDKEALARAAEFQHEMAKIEPMMNRIKSGIVKYLFPALNWLIDKAAALVNGFTRLNKNTNILKHILMMLLPVLAVLAIQMAITFAPILLAGAAVLSLILLVDDLLTMFEGGESVIGDTIDQIFGKGQSAELVKTVKDAWTEVKQAFIDMWPYVKQVYNALKWVVDHAAEVGGAFGNRLAEKRNIEIMTAAGTSGEIKKGRGGLTFEENLTGLNAQAYLDARNRGEEMSKFVAPNQAKGMTNAQVIEAVKGWLPRIESGQFPQFRPETYGPAPAPGGGDINVAVTVQGTNAQPHEIKAAVKQGVQEARQEYNLAAKHAVTQAGRKP